MPFERTEWMRPASVHQPAVRYLYSTQGQCRGQSYFDRASPISIHRQRYCQRVASFGLRAKSRQALSGSRCCWGVAYDPEEGVGVGTYMWVNF